MKFSVFGNPIAHSLSPSIHQQFAEQFDLELEYSRSLASNAGFAEAVAAFFRSGGAGANVTVPFKSKAAALVTHLTPRAARAGAVNTLIPLGHGQLAGDSTDGEGLMRDLQRLLPRQALAVEVLVIGAGGAASSVIEALQDAGANVIMTNRSEGKVAALQQTFPGLDALRYEELSRTPAAAFTPKIIINATSASLAGAGLPIHPDWFAQADLAYDMMYAKDGTDFLRQAKNGGCRQLADGLGMLVEQAALSFALWHDGRLPNTTQVLAALRQQMFAD